MASNPKLTAGETAQVAWLVARMAKRGVAASNSPTGDVHQGDLQRKVDRITDKAAERTRLEAEAARRQLDQARQATAAAKVAERAAKREDRPAARKARIAAQDAERRAERVARRYQ